jgi:DNA-binding NarL/FixJ family response regulator
VCNAVRIAVAADSRERRLELRRAAVTAEWEVVTEADNPEAAYSETIERRARFLVLDASAAGPRPEVIVSRLKSMAPLTFVVGVGDVAGTDANLPADDLSGLRDTIRGLLHDSGDHTHA